MRITVVILFTLVGWLLQHFGIVPEAMWPAALLGMLAANFVPMRGSCPLPRRPE